MHAKLRISLFLSVLVIAAWWWIQGGMDYPVPENAPIQPIRVKGITLEAPPRQATDNPMLELTAIHANWIAVIPFGFTRSDQPMVQFNHERQWWGERLSGVRSTIEQAHQANLHVLLKPQIWIHGQWTGDLKYTSDSDWQNWESTYTRFILTFASLADSLGVELFCLGTEFREAVAARPHFWQNLIHQIRQTYRGSITYAANWDDFDQVPFWNDLDYIGINAYFPLLKDANPTVPDLVKAWNPFRKKIRNFSARLNKPVLFTEYGYLSVDGCTYNTWELEDRLTNCQSNESAQANALDALYSVWSREPYWQGGFLWKWYPQISHRHRHLDKDYTPQGKTAETVISKWFHP